MKNYFGIVVFLLMACNGSSDGTTERKDSTANQPVTKNAANIGFKDAKLQGIYTSYLHLKNALVESKPDLAKTAAKGLSGELKSYTGCENTSLIADKIVNAPNIEIQRKEFTGLSSDIIALFTHAELTAGTIFVQHCPMANHGDGGDWLSSEKKIQNPYYGTEMLECGAVTSEIKTK